MKTFTTSQFRSKDSRRQALQQGCKVCALGAALILTISGTTLDFRSYILEGTATTNHTGTLGLRAQPSVWKEMWWNYAADPHGQDTTRTYLLEDPDSSNCHQVFETDTFILGCTKIPDYTLSGTVIRPGDLPTSWDAFFAGSTHTVSITSNEAHPSSDNFKFCYVVIAYEFPKDEFVGYMALDFEDISKKLEELFTPCQMAPYENNRTAMENLVANNGTLVVPKEVADNDEGNEE